VRIAYISGGLTGDRLELEVRDDGKGFQVPDAGHDSRRKDEIPRPSRTDGLSGETLALEVRRGGEAASPAQRRQEDPQLGGHGLQTMRERAAELGGSCRIERMDGGGTRLLAVLPIPAGREETSA
jgi:signal transduction histidine kinase